MCEPTRRWQEASEPTDRRHRHAMGCRPSGLTHIQQVRSVFLHMLMLMLIGHRSATKDVELLVLRHEVAVYTYG